MASDRPGDEFGQLLSTVGRLLLVMLVALSCFLILQLGLAARRIERIVAATADEIETVAHTASDVAEQIDRIRDQIERLQARAEQTIPFDEIDGILDELAVLRNPPKSNQTSFDDRAEAEIKHLLIAIRGSGCRFEYDDSSKGGLAFYLLLRSKYSAYRRTLQSTDDFIDKVATQTITRHTYHIVCGSSGEKQPLATWLREQLAAHRVAEKQDTLSPQEPLENE